MVIFAFFHLFFSNFAMFNQRKYKNGKQMGKDFLRKVGKQWC